MGRSDVESSHSPQIYSGITPQANWLKETEKKSDSLKIALLKICVFSMRWEAFGVGFGTEPTLSWATLIFLWEPHNSRKRCKIGWMTVAFPLNELPH